MANAFNLTAQINLQGPANLRPIVGKIKRELGSIQDLNLKFKFDTKAVKSVDAVSSKLQKMNAILIEARSNVNAINSSLAKLSSAMGSVSSASSSGSRSIDQTAKSMRNVAVQTKYAAGSIEEFGKQTRIAIKRFAAFSVGTTAIYGLVNAINVGFKAFLEFDSVLVKLQQVTGSGAVGIKELSNTITQLSVSLGVSSSKLAETAITLAQAGFTAKETEQALRALAKTELAPSFDDIAKTTEGAIAALRQFGIQAGELEAALGSINAVAAAFAVESSDIIAAIQRTGGVFASASKGVSQGTDALNEFIAIFTSVRATTRESAETIATGLRTIFTRIQRGSTIEYLRQFGIELQDSQGKFVGAYEAIRRLSEGLKDLDPRDVRFTRIVEELGGFRQIGKVIPLIQEFATAQEALKVAQGGQSSLTQAQIKAQQSLVVQIAKVREEFLALIRSIGDSQGFRTFISLTLSATSALIKLASVFKPILPLLAIVGALKGLGAVGKFATGFAGSFKRGGGAGEFGETVGGSITSGSEKDRAEATKRSSEAIRNNTDALVNLTSAVNNLTNAMATRKFNEGGKVLAFARGGVVPGSGNRDTVPAMLQPGEFVIRKKAVETIGASRLQSINKYADGGPVSPKQLYSKQMQEYVKTNLDPNDSIYFDKTVYGLQSTKNVKADTFEELVYDKLGGEKIAGNYPVDIIGTAQGPVEVRNRQKRTPDYVLADKLMRYYLDPTSAFNKKAKAFTGKKNNKAEDINLGNIGIAYNLTKYTPTENFTKLGIGGSVEDLAASKQLKMEDAALEMLTDLGGIQAVKGLLGVRANDRTLDGLLRKGSIQSGKNIQQVLQFLNEASKRAGNIDAGFTKVGLAGLGPLDYSKDFEYQLGGRNVKVVARGFASKYLDTIMKFKEEAGNLKTNLAQNLQYADIFEAGKSLVFDFDDTLVEGADILGPDGKPDIAQYSNRDAVKAALGKGSLTGLGQKLKSLSDLDPNIIAGARILTARPQSTVDLLGSALRSLGLPFNDSQITGVSTGLGSNIGQLKAANLTNTERLIDDTLANIEAARGAGRSAVLYQRPKPRSSAFNELMGQGNIEGAAIEGALAELIPGLDLANAERNRAIDFASGLGEAARFFPGIDGSWPTEIKRTIDKYSLEQTRDEIARAFSENLFANGGKVPSVNEVGAQIAGEFDLVKGKNAFNQLKNNCLEIARKVADQFGYMADESKIRTTLDTFKKIRLGKNSKAGIQLTPELLAKSPTLKRLSEDPTSAKSSGNILIREGEELMSHVSFEHMNKEYNFGAAGKDWPIVLRIPLKRKEQQFAMGGSAQDTVPALLTPGEFVINKKAAAKIGSSQLNRLNKADKIQGYNKGGSVGFVQRFAAGGPADPGILGALGSAISSTIDKIKSFSDALKAPKVEFLGPDVPKRIDAFADAAQRAGQSLDKFAQNTKKDSVARALQLKQQKEVSRKDLTTSLVRASAGAGNAGFDLNESERKIKASLNAFADRFGEGVNLDDLAASISVFINDTGAGIDELKTKFPELASALDDTRDSTDSIIEAEKELASEFGGLINSVKMTKEQLAAVEYETSGQAKKDFGVLSKVVSPERLLAFKNTAAGARTLETGKRLDTTLGFDPAGKAGKAVNFLNEGLKSLPGPLGEAAKGIGGLSGVLGVAASIIGDSVVPQLTNLIGLGNSEFGAGVAGALSQGGQLAASGAAIGAQTGIPGAAAVLALAGGVFGAVKGFFEAAKSQELKNNLMALSAATDNVKKKFEEFEIAKTAETEKALLGAVGEQFVQQQKLSAMAAPEKQNSVLASTTAGIMSGLAVTALLAAFTPLGPVMLLAAGAGVALGATFGLLSEKITDEAWEAGRKNFEDLYESINKIASVKGSAKSLDEINAELDRIKKGDRTAGGIRQAAAASAIEQKFQNYDPTKSLEENLRKLGPAARATADEAKRTLAIERARAQLLKQAGGDVQTARKEERKLGEEGLRAAGEKLIDAEEKQLLLKLQQEALSREINTQTENLVRKFEKLSAQIKKFDAEQERLSKNTEQRAALAVGEGQTLGANRMNEDVISNIGAYSNEEFNAALDQIRAAGGDQTLVEGVQAQRQIELELPKLLEGATSQDTGEIGAEIRDIFTKAGISGELSNQFAKQVEDQLATSQGSRQGKSFEELLEEFPALRDSIKATTAAQKTAGELLKSNNDQYDRIRDNLNKYSDALDKAREYTLKAAQVSLESENQIREARGETLTLEQRNRPAEAEIRSLTDEAFGGEGKGATDIDSIVAKFKELRVQTDAYSQRAGKLSTQEQTDYENLRRTQGNLRKAMEAVASSSQRAANAMEIFKDNMRVREAGTKTLRDIYTGDTERVTEITTNLNDAQALLRGPGDPRFMGNNGARRASGFAGVDMLASMMPGQMGQQLQAKAQLNMMTEGQKQQLSEIKVQQMGPEGMTEVSLLDALKQQAEGKVEDPMLTAAKQFAEEQRKANEAIAALYKESGEKFLNAVSQFDTAVKNFKGERAAEAAAANQQRNAQQGVAVVPPGQKVSVENARVAKYGLNDEQIAKVDAFMAADKKLKELEDKKNKGTLGNQELASIETVRKEKQKAEAELRKDPAYNNNADFKRYVQYRKEQASGMGGVDAEGNFVPFEGVRVYDPKVDAPTMPRVGTVTPTQPAIQPPQAAAANTAAVVAPTVAQAVQAALPAVVQAAQQLPPDMQQQAMGMVAQAANAGALPGLPGGADLFAGLAPILTQSFSEAQAQAQAGLITLFQQQISEIQGLATLLKVLPSQFSLGIPTTGYTFQIDESSKTFLSEFNNKFGEYVKTLQTVFPSRIDMVGRHTVNVNVTSTDLKNLDETWKNMIATEIDKKFKSISDATGGALGYIPPSRLT